MLHNYQRNIRVASSEPHRLKFFYQTTILYHTISTFNDLEKEAFLKFCGKRRPTFSSFSTIFSTLPKPIFKFFFFFFVVCKCFQFGPFQKICCLVKSLIGNNSSIWFEGLKNMKSIFCPSLSLQPCRRQWGNTRHKNTRMTGSFIMLG